MDDKPKRKSRRKCQSQYCKGRTGWGNIAVYRVGSDGFNAKKGALVCDHWTCMSWGSGGYPVTFHSVDS